MRCVFYLKTSMIFTTHDLESVSQYVLSLSVRTLTKTKELLILIRLTEFRQQSFLWTLPIHSQENCTNGRNSRKLFLSLRTDHPINIASRSTNVIICEVTKALWNLWTTKGSFTLANVIFIVATHCSALQKQLCCSLPKIMWTSFWTNDWWKKNKQCYLC